MNQILYPNLMKSLCALLLLVICNLDLLTTFWPCQAPDHGLHISLDFFWVPHCNGSKSPLGVVSGFTVGELWSTINGNCKSWSRAWIKFRTDKFSMILGNMFVHFHCFIAAYTALTGLWSEGGVYKGYWTQWSSARFCVWVSTHCDDRYGFFPLALF